MILPWLIAIIVYLWATDNLLSITYSSFYKIYFFPYYHLWYVPSLFLFILCTWFLKNYDELIIIIMALGIFMFFFNSYYFNNQFITKLINVYKPHYFIFYLSGYFFRKYHFVNHVNEKVISYIMCLLILLIFYRISNFYFALSPFLFIDFYVLNISIIFLMLTCITDDKMRLNYSTYLIWLGKNSLPVYLYHVLIILLSKSIFLPHLYIIYWYSLTTLLIISLIIMIYYLSKLEYINKYFFGNYQITA